MKSQLWPRIVKVFILDRLILKLQAGAKHDISARKGRDILEE
jgi:hypothetical protein